MIKDRFCCAGCGEMLLMEQAHMVFQTGFYRVVQPLGCCKACMEKAANPQAAEMDRGLEASVVQLPQVKSAGSGFTDSTPAASFTVHIPMVASL